MDCRKKNDELRSEHSRIDNYIRYLEERLKQMQNLEQELERQKVRHFELEAEKSTLLEALEKSEQIRKTGQSIAQSPKEKMVMQPTLSVFSWPSIKMENKKRPIEFDTEETSIAKRPKISNKPVAKVNLDLQKIRRRIPERLNSGYVIHALLCSSLNGLGADIIKDEKGMIERIHITSFWKLKNYCIFIIKNVLRKKTSVSCSSNWDKTLRQRWFEGWTQKESFVVAPKDDRKMVISDLLQGHSVMTEEEKRALSEQVQRWSVEDEINSGFTYNDVSIKEEPTENEDSLSNSPPRTTTSNSGTVTNGIMSYNNNSDYQSMSEQSSPKKEQDEGMWLYHDRTNDRSMDKRVTKESMQ
eukprot:TRINITY_DN2427_c0_g1_i1.p1 TRINITY_DN2427_c0_g1~~TRINITY_DN2427_c0_g1_i1.p1  ORF type:complete len:356 (+),score=62.26 TRINITY_DN2427_c0_g1_i1:314-1381(+)